MEQFFVLLQGPLVSIDCRVEVIRPSFPTFFISSKKFHLRTHENLIGDYFPADFLTFGINSLDSVNK